LDLQDIERTPDPTARVMWLSLEAQFLGNAQTRALQLDAELRTLEQGDLFVRDYCRKMKSTADGLRDLVFTVPENILVLNILQGLPSSYEAMRTLLTHQQPPPTFLQVRDALTLEELTRGHHTPASAVPSSSTSRVLVAAPPPSSASPLASLLGAPPPGPSGGGGRGGRRGRRGRGGGGRGMPTQSLTPPLAPLPGGAPWPTISQLWSGRISMWPYQGQGGGPRPSHQPEAMVMSVASYAPTWTPPPPPSSSWTRGVGSGCPGAVLQNCGADAARRHRVDHRLVCFLPHYSCCGYPFFCPASSPLLSFLHHGQ
jgi:hypothetical protein